MSGVTGWRQGVSSHCRADRNSPLPSFPLPPSTTGIISFSGVTLLQEDEIEIDAEEEECMDGCMNAVSREAIVTMEDKQFQLWLLIPKKPGYADLMIKTFHLFDMRNKIGWRMNTLSLSICPVFLGNELFSD